MINMKPIAVSVICLLSLTLGGQNQQPMTTKKFHDAEAEKVLKELQTKLNSYANVLIEFAFQSEKDDKIIDEMRGSISVKGTRYVLTTPMLQIYCNGVTVWSYLPEQKEVTVSDYSEDDDSQMMNPLSLVKNYAKHYRSNFIKEGLNKGVMEQIIDLTPLKASSLLKVRLVIDKNKKQIIRIILYEKDGMRYTYAITKFLTNQPIDDKKFTFDTAANPNVEVIDMR